VSWLFSFLLLCYVAVRLLLRVRGQIRWMAIRDTLPVPPTMVPAPEQLSAPLAELFVASLALRAELVRARRELSAVQIQDPDAPLGCVRDARYRRAVMTSWSRISEYLRGLEALDPASAGALLDSGIEARAITSLRDSLRGPWTTVARARALDPFELDDLLAVAQTLERIEHQLASIERALARLGEHPYRDKPCAAPHPCAEPAGAAMAEHPLATG
jgi:hypothetical protein